MEDVATPPETMPRVSLHSLNGEAKTIVAIVPPPPVEPGPDGSFRIDRVITGEFRLDMRGLPAGLYIKEARYRIGTPVP